MSDEKAKRERGIKVMTKRRITLEEDGVLVRKEVGEVLTLSKEMVKHFGAAVTRDVPDADDED